MVKTSTLIYLVDNTKTPSDMFLSPDFDNIIEDEFYFLFLNLLETDPGEELVSRVLEKI